MDFKDRKIHMLELQKAHCERHHAFCMDCRDKLEPGVCLRCENQKLQVRIEQLENQLKHFKLSTHNERV